MTDAVQVMWEYLTVAGTTLYARVGTRIWSPVAKKGFENTHPAIVYWLEPRRQGGPDPLGLCSFWFRSYGGAATFQPARVTAGLLHDRLHAVYGQSTASGRIVSAQFVDGQQLPPDPETKWPSELSNYAVEIV